VNPPGRRIPHGACAAALAVALVAMPPLALRAEEIVEPPPEAESGADYAIEAADSLADETIEVGLGATGRPGGGPRRTRRIRFRGEGLNATMREGAGDPLAGGVIEGRVAHGTVRAGRLAPRWGRGLVFGATAEPWDSRAADRGGSAGRAGDGVVFRRGDRHGIETMAGTFERRRIGGLGWYAGPWHVGGVAASRRRAQSSLAFAGARDELEIALDQAGRWRIEALRAHAFGGGRIEAQARAGVTTFRSLAEPKRSGPAQSMTVRYVQGDDARRVQVLGSWWRFRPGAFGARAALQLSGDVPAGRAVLGVEEQQGPRRLTSAALRARDLRQGVWGEWTAGDPDLTLTLRQEVWGGQRLRDAIRRVSGVRVEVAGPGSARLRVAHTVFRTAFGENLYLRETYSDRLVLRALSGSGTRTFMSCAVPAGGGRMTVSMQLTRTRAGPLRMVWTFDWARHARAKR